MSFSQQMITLAVVILALQLCRWVAFWVFPAHQAIPSYVQYLGYALPPAVFGMLVIYCYKNVDILGRYHGLPELIAGAVVIALHLWRRNMFISILVGTGFYMLLVQKIFIN